MLAGDDTYSLFFGLIKTDTNTNIWMDRIETKSVFFSGFFIFFQIDPFKNDHSLDDVDLLSSNQQKMIVVVALDVDYHYHYGLNLDIFSFWFYWLNWWWYSMKIFSFFHSFTCSRSFSPNLCFFCVVYMLYVVYMVIWSSNFVVVVVSLRRRRRRRRYIGWLYKCFH